MKTEEITNDAVVSALVGAGIPSEDVELWHTGGGIMNVTVVTHRDKTKDRPVDATDAWPGQADAWIMFGDANLGELFFDGHLNAGVFDDRGDREGWCDSIKEYSDDDDLNLTTLDAVASFIRAEYDKYRTMYDETIDHSHDFAWVTAGAMRTLLEGVDDDVPIVVARDGWYDNIENVVIPGTDAEKAEYVCVTLSLGGSFDCRSQV